MDNVHQMLDNIRQELLNSPPQDALTTSDYIVKLTALLGNINDEIGEWDAVYIKSYNDIMTVDPKLAADKLKLRAMNTIGYQQLQRAKRASDLCLELVGGLKYRVRALVGEFGQSNNQ